MLAPRLMALLNLKTGDTIDVGDATLRIAGEVIQEPDSGFNPFQMAPRLMMNLADVDKTGAVQPGSRVTWRYKFGGNENQLDGYEKWLLPQLKPEQRWYGLEQDEGALGRSMERSQQFLLLSALLTLLLAVAAVAVAMNHYCRSRYDLVAILKTLGAGRAQLRKLIVGQWLMVLTLSAVTGGAIGLLFENVLMVLLKPVLPAALPPASLWPWLWALGTMTVISLLVGYDHTACCWQRSLYAYYVMMWSRTVAAEVLSADCQCGGCAAARRINGWQHAALGGAGGRGSTGFAVRCAGLDAAECTSPHDAEIAASAPGG